MFQIKNTLVSEAILDTHFCCDLNACKGACCIEGTGGAPLEKEELPLLEKHYATIKKYLTEKGIQAVEHQGTHTQNDFGEYETPLINGGACAYVVFDEKGKAGCAFEKAYQKGEIDWKKPISCHLYPVRLQKMGRFIAVNYHQWKICNSACSLGKKLKLPVYQFLKNALIRRFGKKWYEELSLVAREWLLVHKNKT